MLRDQPSTTLPTPAGSAPPRIWLFTDQRNDERLERTILQLPRGSGIVFRHYHLDETSRRKRFESVRKLARRRGHILFLAGSPTLSMRWRADGVYGRTSSRSQTRRLPLSVPVHNAREIHQANRAGAALVFLSPIFATRSHPGQRPLNPLQARHLAALSRGAVIFLGGMGRRLYRSRKNHLVHGWAAIDAFS